MNSGDNQSSSGGAIQKNLSVRPKVRNRNSFNLYDKKVNYEPLDKKVVSFNDQNKVSTKKSIPLISKEFNLMINCVTYYEPSFEELNNAMNGSLNSWIMNCKKFENMLSNLVNISYFRFWSVIAFNTDVHSSLESYLANSVRPYRLHPLLKNNEIKPVLSSIHTLVFKVFVRLLRSKESEQNYLSESYHFELLISRNLVDISNIFSLLQLYGYGVSSEMLKYLLTPFVQKSLVQLKTVCDEIGTMFASYASDDKDDSEDCPNNFDLRNDSKIELNNLISNVTDILFAFNKLVAMDPEVCSIYQQSGLTEKFISFYGKFFPFIEMKCSQMCRQEKIVENLLKFYKCQISLAQSSGLLMFHHSLKNVFVHSLLNHSDGDPQFDLLFNILNVIISDKKFCYDYFSKFLFEKEFEPLLNNRQLNEQFCIDSVMEYYNVEIKKIISNWKDNADDNMADQCDLTQVENKPDNINGVKINLSYEPIASTSQSNQPKMQQPEPVVDDIRMDSETTMKEEMIREMFPDFGDGFIYKVLEYFEFNNERVIDAILESNLPPELESLNRQFKKSDLIAAKRMAAAAASSNNNQSSLPSEPPRYVDKYDPTATKHLELAQIYIGKKDKISEVVADKDKIKDRTMQLMEKIQDEEEEARENVKTLIERGKLDKAELKTNIDYIGFDLYDDEFDDTYVKEENFEMYAPEDESGDETDDDNEPSSEYQHQNSDFPQLPEQGQSNDSRPGAMFKQQHNNAEKQGNFYRFAKKQLYNKRNFNRQQNTKSGPGPQQQSNQQTHPTPSQQQQPNNNQQQRRPNNNNPNNRSNNQNRPNNNNNRANNNRQGPPQPPPPSQSSSNSGDQQQQSSSNQANQSSSGNPQNRPNTANRPNNSNNNNRKFHNNTTRNNNQQNRKN